jgi:hypothetical protein
MRAVPAVVIIMVASLGFGQDSAKPLPIDQRSSSGTLEKLKRGPILNVRIEGVTLEEAFVRLLRLAKMPGGIVLRTGRSSIFF